MKTGQWFRKTPVKICASLLLAFFLFWRLGNFYLQAFHGLAWDYSINWIAALGIREGLSLYDHPALQELAVSRIDSGMKILFGGRFTSFIGLPSTAILHLPFTWLPYETSVLVYRVTSLLAMIGAIAIAGLALPVSLRVRAWWAGLLCLLTWNAFPLSIKLGQVDAWVLLSLAGAVLAVSRGWWRCAGVAMGVAALLKISPVWLLFYCLLKRQWTVLLASAACIASGLLVSAWPQHGQDLVQFFVEVLPSLGDSPLHVQNQALGAFLARLTTGDVQLLSFVAGTGYWKMVGAGVAAVLLLSLSAGRQKNTAIAEELAAVILLALLAGPLTWDHYLAWAIIPVMLLAARLSLVHALLLCGVLLPLMFPVPYLSADVIAEHGSWRWLTGLQVVSVLALAVWMVSRCRKAGC
jgi:hypothetical protein